VIFHPTVGHQDQASNQNIEGYYHDKIVDEQSEEPTPYATAARPSHRSGNFNPVVSHLPSRR
jgi:hypothetical protein